MVLLTLMAGVQSVQQHDSSFELLGFDIMLDQSLKPWLIEVNGSPALSCDCAADDRVKPSLINDTLDTLDLDAFKEISIAAMQRRLAHRRDDYMSLVSGDGAHQKVAVGASCTVPRSREHVRIYACNCG